MLAQSVLNSRDSVPEAGWNEAGQSAGLRMAGQQRSLRDRRRTAPSAPALQQVQIVIAWTDRRGPRQLELTTLLPQAKPRSRGAAMSRARPHGPGRMSGFTLVEILVAMTLMSVVMLALGAAMRTIAQTEERVDQRLEQADEMRVATSFLSATLERISRPKERRAHSGRIEPLPFRRCAERGDVGGRDACPLWRRRQIFLPARPGQPGTGSRAGDPLRALERKCCLSGLGRGRVPGSGAECDWLWPGIR